jgi:UDP-N-acetylglucosamine 2-epimerase
MSAAMPHPFPMPEILAPGKRLVLVTVHRRESFGEPMVRIFTALRQIARLHADVEMVYPVHLNPNVRQPAQELLGNEKNIHLVPPMDYFDFVQMMKHAYQARVSYPHRFRRSSGRGAHAWRTGAGVA